MTEDAALNEIELELWG